MVRLFIKEEYMSMQDRMIVKTESGQDIYLIVGKWGRKGDALSLYTMDGERLVEARQRKLSLFPKFDLFVDGQKRATIKKHPGLRGIKQPYFTISKLHWLITGDFLEQKYSIRRYTQLIMKLEKNYSFIGDFYSLNIYKEEVAPICCVLAVIVDHLSPNKDTLWQHVKHKQYSLGFVHSFILKYQKCRSNSKTEKQNHC